MKIETEAIGRKGDLVMGFNFDKMEIVPTVDSASCNCDADGSQSSGCDCDGQNGF